MSYIDGFVIPVPKKKLPAYLAMARKASRLWREHGALEYRECVADDVTGEVGIPFPRLAKAKPSETVVFSYVVYRSRAHRDKVNAAVMKDPRVAALCDEAKMPFDCRRMAWGGFKVAVKA